MQCVLFDKFPPGFDGFAHEHAEEAFGFVQVIDVDFEHERREEVLQHIDEKYGRERGAIAAIAERWDAAPDGIRALALHPYPQVERAAQRPCARGRAERAH